MNPFPARFLLGLCSLFAVAFARADEYCVHDSAGLQAALDRATLAFTDDSVIRLRQGTYTTAGWLGNDSDHPIVNDLSLLGGYADANCSEAGRSLDPALTTLRAATPGGADRLFLVIDGSLLLKSLTLRGYGKGVYLISPDPLFGADDQWTLDRVRIEGSGGFVEDIGGPHHALYVSTHGDADLSLQQVVIADNVSGEWAGIDCAAMIAPDDNAVVVKQSTFAYNADYALCIDAFNGDGDTRVDLDNNIFSGNGCGLDVAAVSGANLRLRRNTIDCNTFDELPAVNLGNDSLDPQFRDAAGRDYRLLASSPAIDAGVDAPTGGQAGSDITGGPRVLGAAVDRGPWESNSPNATDLVVTTTADVGDGSLRSALTLANATPGRQVIRFDIPGACPRLITLGSLLPDITDSVRIEGYSQPGSVAGATSTRTICVGLWGNQARDHLLRVSNDSASLDVSGLGFGGTTFNPTAAAIRLNAGGAHWIVGNQFGGAIGPPNQTIALNVLQNGIYATGSVRDSYLGGFDPESSNVFNSARAPAIEIRDTTTDPANLQVLNNYIGLRPNGIGVDANVYGVYIANSAGNLVDGNWISGNTQDGVALLREGTRRNIVRNNQIGRCPLCLNPTGSEILLGNGGHGVRNQLGAAANQIYRNAIAGNGQNGYMETDSAGDALSSNRIYRNGGLGIDIGADGVTPNDAGGINPDGVPNHPLLASAGGGFYDGQVSGSLTAAPQQTYLIELFASQACDASGYGEGERAVGWTLVTTPASPLPGLYSTVSFDLAIHSGGLAGKAISATAIAVPNGGISEFSPCRQYVYSDVIFRNGFDLLLP